MIAAGGAMEVATKNPAVRVLIAEDEAHIRTVLRAIMTALGAEIVGEAADGEDAVALAAQMRPHIVLLDINMPRLTGDAALERILAGDPHVVAIMMTAQDTLEAVRRCLDLGARDYILKSNRAEEIFRLLREAWPTYVEEALGGGAA
jgi:YesN/AraC family two-component response regulator